MQLCCVGKELSDLFHMHSRSARIDATVSIGEPNIEEIEEFPPDLKDSRAEDYSGPLCDYRSLPAVTMSFRDPRIDTPIKISVFFGPSWYLCFAKGDAK